MVVCYDSAKGQPALFKTIPVDWVRILSRNGSSGPLYIKVSNLLPAFVQPDENSLWLKLTDLKLQYFTYIEGLRGLI